MPFKHFFRGPTTLESRQPLFSVEVLFSEGDALGLVLFNLANLWNKPVPTTPPLSSLLRKPHFSDLLKHF